MSKLVEQLDFSTVGEPITGIDRKEFEAWRKTVGNDSSTGLSWFFRSIGMVASPAAILLFLLVTAVFYIFSVVGNSPNGGNDYSSPGPILFFWIVGAVLTTYMLYRHKKKLQASGIKAFRLASRNGLGLKYMEQNPNYQGVIFTVGASRELKDALVFPGGVEVGNYSYADGTGRNEVVYRWSYARVELGRRLPNMLLDAVQNNLKILGVNRSNLPTYLQRGQKLSLEGDFDKYFSLYAPKGSEREVLTILTPDVMQRLIDSAHNFDIEIIDSKLMVYFGKTVNLTDKDDLNSLLDVVEAILPDLIKQVGNVKRSETDTSSVSSIASDIATEPSMLKQISFFRKHKIYSVVIVVVILAALMSAAVGGIVVVLGIIMAILG